MMAIYRPTYRDQNTNVDHAAAVALYFMYYNFARIHQTLRCSPAMAAGVDNRLNNHDIYRTRLPLAGMYFFEVFGHELSHQAFPGIAAGKDTAPMI
jgi:hypothetical protein